MALTCGRCHPALGKPISITGRNLSGGADQWSVSKLWESLRSFNCFKYLYSGFSCVEYLHCYRFKRSIRCVLYCACYIGASGWLQARSAAKTILIHFCYLALPPGLGLGWAFWVFSSVTATHAGAGVATIAVFVANAICMNQCITGPKS